MKIILKSLLLICLLSIFSSSFLPKNENIIENSIKNNEEIHWAVLVAGSNSFWNYRHQSDIFHAYQILVKKGLSPDNIITMAYDDIANSSQNPIKGKVFNKPDPHGEGQDNYEGVQIDYKGRDVNAKNFLNIITGNKSEIKGGNGRVLESKSTDNVFIYFADHGAVGLIAFPSTQLYADQLNNALMNMHENKMYKKLVFYLEACESGSMFENILKKDIGIYATTAANPKQSSWATYCDPDDKINGVSIGSCLGDEYSVNWLENTEKILNNQEESLEEQYEIVKQNTKKSAVQQYGDFSYLDETINDFEGYDNNKEKDSLIRRIIKFLTEKICDFRRIINLPCTDLTINKYYNEYLEKAKSSTVESRKAKIEYLIKKTQKSNDPIYEEMLKNEIEHMENTNKIFKDFDIIFEIDNKVEINKIEFDCLRNSIEAYKKCNTFDEYDLIFARNIVNACNKHNSDNVIQFFNNLC